MILALQLGEIKSATDSMGYLTPLSDLLEPMIKAQLQPDANGNGSIIVDATDGAFNILFGNELNIYNQTLNQNGISLLTYHVEI